MNAVILATGAPSSFAPLDERTPMPLLPVLDKPIVHHLIEHLVECGVTEFDLILSLMPEKVREALGDGRRWGSQFHYHVARDPERPYGVIRSIARGRPLLVASSHALVDARHLAANPPARAVALMDARTNRWTGWLWLPSGSADLLSSSMEAPSSDRDIRPSIDSITVDSLPLESFDDLLTANRMAVSGQFAALKTPVRSAQPGVWLSNNVVLHPTARVEPPVYVGRNCRIMQGARIGPNAVIGHDCIIDSHSVVSDSVVFAGTYVGEALELVQAIADRNRLVSVRNAAAIRVSDDFLLSALRPERRRVRGQFLSRVVALLLLLLLLPVLLVTALLLLIFRRGPVMTTRKGVRTPAEPDADSWREVDLLTFSSAKDPFKDEIGLRHVFLCFVPALISVLKGDLRFVGVAPRSAAEIEHLPHDWRVLYLNSKAGIVSEGYVQHGPAAGADDVYTSEVFYSVSSSRMYDIKVLLRYLAAVLSAQHRSRDGGAEASAGA
jgi:lipopolysaccharide/colanic/teichoic acid biosynthesis glycosyltransferase